MLVLGRVMTGRGGDLILENARRVLDTEFPIVGAHGLPGSHDEGQASDRPLPQPACPPLPRPSGPETVPILR